MGYGRWSELGVLCYDRSVTLARARVRRKYIGVSVVEQQQNRYRVVCKKNTCISVSADLDKE